RRSARGPQCPAGPPPARSSRRLGGRRVFAPPQTSGRRRRSQGATAAIAPPARSLCAAPPTGTGIAASTRALGAPSAEGPARRTRDRSPAAPLGARGG